MPQLGETVSEGTITRWLKAVGDQVTADEPLLEVSTDKVDTEVPAPTSGVLTEIRAHEGDTVAVGTVLAVIGDALSVPVPHAGAPEPDVPSEESDDSLDASAPAHDGSTPVTTEPAMVEPAVPAGDARFTSPVVRRLVAEHGLDPVALEGSGEGGRVTRRDVMDAAARARADDVAPAPAEPEDPPAAMSEPAMPEPAMPEPATHGVSPPPAPDVASPEPVVTPATEGRAGEQPAQPEPDEGTVIKFSSIRRRTAEHMVRSRATSPHAYTSVEVDFERVERVRRSHGAQWREREGFSLTYLPFIARALSDSVDDYPIVNASVDGNSIVVHPVLNLGVAVDLDFQGLIVPVIHDAAGKRLRQIAQELRDLATRARAKQLGPDDVSGGTFTITNPGPYGTYQTLPIINQPQVAILATDGITKRPMVIEGPDGGDVIAVRHVGVLTLAWDHRAFDGAYAAAFLSAMRDVLQTRDWEAELA